MRRDPEFQVLHHLAVFGPADVLFIVIAHDRQLSDFSSFFEGGSRAPDGAGLSAKLMPRLRRGFTHTGFHPDARSVTPTSLPAAAKLLLRALRLILRFDM